MNRQRRRLRVRPNRKSNRNALILGGFVPPIADSDWHRLESELTHLEASIQSFRERFDQSRALQTEHRQRSADLQNADLTPAAVNQLKHRLLTLEEQWDELTFDWRSLREPFWQAVRFGGVGIILGWVLHQLAAR